MQHVATILLNLLEKDHAVIVQEDIFCTLNFTITFSILKHSLGEGGS